MKVVTVLRRGGDRGNSGILNFQGKREVKVCHYGGVVIAAFANFYGDCTNSIVELRALSDGLKLCSSLGFREFHVNTDSAATVLCISKRKCGFWKGWYWFQEVLELIDSLKPMISFTYREGNRAADYLANLACELASDSLFHGVTSLPKDLRWLSCEDASGLPVLRV
ncbi:uncharacterized protein LOC122661847 [Telopea speciosissima]|uniref:uncharacterized protein LOC122661847 n=1 Tax=Telopea speciosissima TaxID=54955 RepID=UPI001CC3A2E1|nr:uncharacterized protein LOC122661847 [Telopea speciosissima]